MGSPVTAPGNAYTCSIVCGGKPVLLFSMSPLALASASEHNCALAFLFINSALEQMVLKPQTMIRNIIRLETTTPYILYGLALKLLVLELLALELLALELSYPGADFKKGEAETLIQINQYRITDAT